MTKSKTKEKDIHTQLENRQIFTRSKIGATYIRPKLLYKQFKKKMIVKENKELITI